MAGWGIRVVEEGGPDWPAELWGAGVESNHPPRPHGWTWQFASHDLLHPIPHFGTVNFELALQPLPIAVFSRPLCLLPYLFFLSV